MLVCVPAQNEVKLRSLYIMCLEASCSSDMAALVPKKVSLKILNLGMCKEVDYQFWGEEVCVVCLGSVVALIMLTFCCRLRELPFSEAPLRSFRLCFHTIRTELITGQIFGCVQLVKIM